jgi:hypothetical protein
MKLKKITLPGINVNCLPAKWEKNKKKGKKRKRNKDLKENSLSVVDFLVLMLCGLLGS